jgi:hypothetical protein
MLPTLAHDIVSEALPWPKAETWDINYFLKVCSLHDSLWLGLHADTGWDGCATAVISLHPHMNEQFIRPSSNSTEWPLLLIHLPAVSNIQIVGYKDIGGIQRGIHHVETTPEPTGRSRTEIMDHYGGAVIVSHSSQIQTLCYDGTGSGLKLNGTPNQAL